jgi:hypothetical protein
MLPSVQAIKDYTATLTPEERTAMQMDDFDYDEFQKRFKSEQETDKDAEEILKTLVKDVSIYRQEAALDKAGVTVPSILRRFEQLAPRWRVYAYVRITESATDTDHVLEEDNGTEKLVNKFFEMMSDAESGYDEWKRKGRRKSQLEYLEFLANVNRILSAAEGK